MIDENAPYSSITSRLGEEDQSWYNNEHRHSGIGLLTPAMVHHGLADQVTERRAEILATAYARHPERFLRGPPRPLTVSQNVWINQPDDTP